MTYSTVNPANLSNSANLSSTHQSNLLTLLTHRLEVAKAHHDDQLVHALELEYEQITALSHPAPSINDRLQQAWMGFAETLSEWNKIHISQTVDVQGNSSWYAYNPQAGQALRTHSQDELRQWIKQTYWGQ